MAEGSSKALDDVTLPAEEKEEEEEEIVTLDFDDDTLTGNYQESLRDATAAYRLQPTYLKAIIRGASASLELNKPEEALRWSVQGLAVSF
nr:tetratricopeptide repeat protein 4-like [Pocillopora verrucosa]